MRTNRLAILGITALTALLAGACGSDEEGGEKKPIVTEPVPLSATLETSMGTMKLSFFYDEAPNTVRNFVELATGEKAWKKGNTMQYYTPLYDGTLFHRVEPDSLIQGGDPKGTGGGGPGYTFDDEVQSGRKFDRGCLIAMANAGLDKDGKGTNGSQFFLSTRALQGLDGKHTIFGEVVEGCEVVTAISRVPRVDGTSRPVTDVVLTKVTITGDLPWQTESGEE